MCVAVCMWGWGVDDGTRMHSAREPSTAMGCIVILIFFFFFYRRGSVHGEWGEGSVI